MLYNLILYVFIVVWGAEILKTAILWRKDIQKPRKKQRFFHNKKFKHQ